MSAIDICLYHNSPHSQIEATVNGKWGGGGGGGGGGEGASGLAELEQLHVESNCERNQHLYLSSTLSKSY